MLSLPFEELFYATKKRQKIGAIRAFGAVELFSIQSFFCLPYFFQKQYQRNIKAFDPGIFVGGHRYWRFVIVLLHCLCCISDPIWLCIGYVGTEKGIAYQHDFLHVGDIDFCSCALVPVDDCGAYFFRIVRGVSIFICCSFKYALVSSSVLGRVKWCVNSHW